MGYFCLIFFLLNPVHIFQKYNLYQLLDVIFYEQLPINETLRVGGLKNIGMQDGNGPVSCHAVCYKKTKAGIETVDMAE